MLPDRPSLPSAAPRPPQKTIANAVRQFLREKRLTLYRVAALTEERFPGRSAYRIRRNFYFQLRSGLSPTIEQIVALAEITGEPTRDLLRLFGFNLEDVPRLQSVLVSPRTTLIDKELADPDLQLPSFAFRDPLESAAALVPLTQLLKRTGSKTSATLLAGARRDVLYAKIGADDRSAFPDQLPNSIVRADPRLVRSLLPRSSGQLSRHLFLLHDARGLLCARLRFLEPNRFVPAVPDSPFNTVDRRVGTNFRILGVVDFEFQFRGTSQRRRNDRVLLGAARQPPQSFRTTARAGPGAFLKRARLEVGLSFRLASERSREIAEILADSRYFASPGTLSDYEIGDARPRHIHKLFTLAIVYAVSLRDLLRSYGIKFEMDASHARENSTRNRRLEGGAPDFFQGLVDRFGDLPLFLASALPRLTGLVSVSVRDAFWIGGHAQRQHPALEEALFVLINRRTKRPRFDRRARFADQPLYLLQERGGSYLVAKCAIENGRLMTYGDSHAAGPPVPLDAEVLGEVVAIARSLLGPT